MSAINIGAENTADAFYRYKMPRLQARIEGRGNGIKTNVVNNVDIAKALERPPDYIIKFYGCELGAQTKYDKKTQTSIVNGAHDTSKLAELLESFIKKYVQCYSCGNPETVVKIRKENIYLKCKACGAMSDVDMRHRLNTYILKNPPEDNMSKAEKKVKKQEKERLQSLAENGDKDKKKKKEKDGKKKKKDDADGGGSGEGSDDVDADENDAEDDVVWMTDTSAEAAKARADEQLSAAMAGMVTQGNIEAEEAERRKREERKAAEERAAAEAERKEQEEAAAAAAVAAAEAAEAEAAMAADPVLRLRAFAAKHTPRELAVEVKALDVDSGPAGRMRVLFEALFAGDTEQKLAAQLTANKAVLRLLGTDAAGQMSQLIALEYLLAEAVPARINEAGTALKALFDNDIVEEDLIIAWAAKASAGKVLGVPPAGAAAVREVAKPFVDWLEEAEESEEDSD